MQEKKEIHGGRISPVFEGNATPVLSSLVDESAEMPRPKIRAGGD